MKKKLIIKETDKLIGKKIGATHLAADMRIFHFFEPKERYDPHKGICLHIQCPWRIEMEDRIITGRSDYWEPLTELPPEKYSEWDPHKDGNLQSKLLADFLKKEITVREVQYDGCGGLTLLFDNDAKLRLFPDGTKSENWRIFYRHAKNHFVVAGGEVGEQED